MALRPCSECKAEISDKAAVCPHCGAPVQASVATLPLKKKAAASEVFGAVVFVIGLCWFAGHMMFSDDPKAEAKAAQETAAKEKAECAAKPLECAGEKGYKQAQRQCPAAIEKLAQYSVRWTNDTLEPKLGRYRWTGPGTDLVTYVGDRAEFQNGNGAYVAVVYECDMAADGKTVTDARVHPGRL